MEKLKLFIDADDTILDSSVAIIEILNNKNGTNKTIEDLTDWEYRSIDGAMTGDKVLELYESDEFFKRVKIKKGVQEYLNSVADQIELIILTKGTKENLRKKQILFNNLLPKAIMFPLTITNNKDMDKSSVDMQGAIQIDDRTDCLKSNANVKILIKDYYKNYNYNKTDNTMENLYVVNNWEEIKDIINFALKQREFLTL